MSHNPEIDPLLDKDFADVMNAMSEVFPSINSKARLKFYWSAVRRLPLRALKEIAQGFLMSAKTMPLPQDFFEAAKEWKRKNNWVPQVLATEVPVNVCAYCRNSGLVRIESHIEPKTDQLMKCYCEESWRMDHVKIPAFGFELKQVYKIGPCPLEWFKPSDNKPSGKEFNTLLEIYKKRIKAAEKYWADLGYKEAG